MCWCLSVIGKKKTFQRKVVEKIETPILRSLSFPENRAVCEIMWNKIVERTGHKWQYGQCALHAGYLRLQLNTHIFVIIIAFLLQ